MILKRGATIRRTIDRGGMTDTHGVIDQVLVLLSCCKDWWDCLCVYQTTNPHLHDYTHETISVHADDLRPGYNEYAEPELREKDRIDEICRRRGWSPLKLGDTAQIIIENKKYTIVRTQ